MGFDWWDAAAVDPMHNSTWNVRAVASGKVVYARGIDWLDTPPSECTPAGGGSCMWAVYIHHYVGVSSTSLYREDFLSVYFHMDDVAVSEGDAIAAGDNIGNVGDTGAPDGQDHLHFGVIRLTNTNYAYQLDPDDVITPGGVYDADWPTQPFIDPFGWQDGSCFPPAVSSRGALSMNLWLSGLAPPDWDHISPTSPYETH